MPEYAIHDQNHTRVATVKAWSHKDAINQYVDEAMPTDCVSAGWSHREFMRFSLTATRLPSRPILILKKQFTTRHWMHIVLLFAGAMAVVSNLVRGQVTVAAGLLVFLVVLESRFLLPR